MKILLIIFVIVVGLFFFFSAEGRSTKFVISILGKLWKRSVSTIEKVVDSVAGWIAKLWYSLHYRIKFIIRSLAGFSLIFSPLLILYFAHSIYQPTTDPCQSDGDAFIVFYLFLIALVAFVGGICLCGHALEQKKKHQ